MKVYRRIRDLREDKDLSQTRVAKEINVSQRTYSYYENGERTIPPEVLVALAKYHNVTVDYILDGINKYLMALANPYK